MWLGRRRFRRDRRLAHFTGEAVVGALTGVELDLFPVATVSWANWRDANPEGLVLSRETGFDRDYGTNPYPGYDDVNTSPFLFDRELDGRLAAKERVIGIERGGASVAVRLDAVTESGVVAVELDGVPWWCGSSRARSRRWTATRWPTAATSAHRACSVPGRTDAT